ncbi:tetratricopeptide repeat protein [Nocardia huaxiensis]|uniref:Tetratricopeptide repeat protein n=1 Tax=Nocardia huaxiensis TaxID=2755382 RepID=A0A7D6VCM7_9NOCA|nr:tetratricopeptide repeat protein [Nocardia huaxiensis]QLY29697.1 tetratricopeptide repeat protein [Nocardia huaxiensis]UFS96728.1 tetratricopeptide repeat protein [Nocardia huaxiensis]
MFDTSQVLEKARVASDLGRLDEARDIVGKALEEAPHDPGLLAEMADIALRLDRVDEALRMAGLAIAADPDLVDAHLTAALAFEAAARDEEAIRHVRVAVSLEPDSPAALLTLAGVLSRVRRTEPAERAEARTAVVRALQLAPTASTHAAAAALELEFGDRAAAEKHVAAGLELNSLHTELHMLRAKLEVWRGGAFGVLRGLLASRPGHLPARQTLAAVTWRATLRAAGWAWAAMALTAVAAQLIPPGGLTWVTPILLAMAPVAWLQVFQQLRRQLPEGYLLRRLRSRGEALPGLAIVLASVLIADTGALFLRTDSNSEAVHTGNLLLVVAALGVGLGHGLLFCAWLRRNGGEEDTLGSYRFAAERLLLFTAAGLAGAGILALLAHSAHQPDAAWTFGAILCVSAGTLAVEMLIAILVQARRRRQRRTAATLAALLAPLILLAAAGFWWTAGHVAAASFRTEDRVEQPITPEVPATTTTSTPPTTTTTPPPTETIAPAPEAPAPPPEGFPPPEGILPPPPPEPPVEVLPPPVDPALEAPAP